MYGQQRYAYQAQQSGEMSWTVLILLICAGIFLLCWLPSFFVVVKEKTAKVLTMFGRFYKVKHAGLGMKPPWPFCQVQDKVNLQIQELKDEITVKSSDNAFLKVPVKVQYQVIKEKVREAYYELADPVAQIISYIVNTVRSKANTMPMDDIFKSKDEFEQAVEETLKQTFEKYGYEIVNVLVDDPQPSSDLRAAFDKVLASEREKEAANNQAEAKRIKMVGEAKAEAESLEIKGKSFKTFRADIAEGNSEAIAKFLEGTNGLEARDVLDFFAGVDMRDAIRDASANPGTVIVVPANYSGDEGKIVSMIKALEPKLEKSD